MKTENIEAEEQFSRLNDAYIKYLLFSPERRYITIALINAVLKHACFGGEEPIIINDVEFLDREKSPEKLRKLKLRCT